MLIIAGHLQVKPDARAGYLAGCVEVVEAARVAPGCVDFTISPDPIDPGRIAIFERWNSDEELMAFRGSGPDSGMSDQIIGAEVSKYRISSVEAP
ncbi:MAG: putative quinol monooxygenase [Solirubrobacterales bacterium]